MEALRFPQAAAVLGPVVPGTVVPNGAKVSRSSSSCEQEALEDRRDLEKGTPLRAVKLGRKWQGIS